MSSSGCERCGFVDWVEAVQCKQCGAYRIEGEAPGSRLSPSARTLKGKSRVGIALAGIYLLLVALIVGSSFRCGWVNNSWSPVGYCLLLTLTLCSMPWPFVFGLALNLFSLLGVQPSANLDWLFFPLNIGGITLNAWLLYKFGETLDKRLRGDF